MNKNTSKVIVFLQTITSICLINTSFAHATDYIVAARQINPDSGAYVAVCNDKKPVCHLHMGIKPQNNTYAADDIDLHMTIVLKKEVVYIQFQSGWDYFALADSKTYFRERLDESKETEKVELYIPHPQVKKDPHHALALRPPVGLVAELEITLERESLIPPLKQSSSL